MTLPAQNPPVTPHLSAKAKASCDLSVPTCSGSHDLRPIISLPVFSLLFLPHTRQAHIRAFALAVLFVGDALPQNLHGTEHLVSGRLHMLKGLSKDKKASEEQEEAVESDPIQETKWLVLLSLPSSWTCPIRVHGTL